MSPSPREPETLAEGTLISHLLELRTRLLRAVVVIAVAFIPLVFFSNQLFTLVAHPLIEKLPEGASLIATSVVSPWASLTVTSPGTPPQPLTRPPSGSRTRAGRPPAPPRGAG